MEAELLCAGACWAGTVMPPAHGLGKGMERGALFAVMLFFVDLDLLVFTVGASALRLLRGEGGERRRSAQNDGAG
jgi:hypothetical protein